MSEERSTVLHWLAWYAEHEGERVQFGFLPEDGAPPRPLTVARLAGQVDRLAGRLVEQGVAPGEVVILLLPPEEGFVVSMLGCQRAGAVPAAIYPPSSPARLVEQAERAAGIITDSGATTVLSCRLLAPFARLLQQRLPGLRRLLLVEDLRAEEQASPPPAALPLPLPAANGIAFLQYSSGSTGNPKGVAIPHRALSAQLELLGRAAGLGDPARDAQERVVSWLPPYHDMGLIGCIFYPIRWGIRSDLASPLTFVRKPWLWLRWLSELQATQTVAPNFAYQRCARSLRQRDLVGLDLSRLRVAWNGAEPIRPAAVQGFIDRFAPCGFRREAFFPVYGLAEATLCVTHPPLGQGVRFDRIDRRRWEEQGQAIPATGEAPAVLEIAEVGLPGQGIELRLVDAAGEPVAERCRGEICVRGTSLMAGYHRRDPSPADFYPGGWLRTGDLGYLAAGRLHVAGRRKDLILVGGRNIFPDDLEEAAAQVEGVRRGRVVVFGVEDLERGTEAIVVCAEAEPDPPLDAATLRRSIRQAVEDRVGLVPGRVEIVPTGWVTKTSSGKLRRQECRQRWQAAAGGGGGGGGAVSEP